MSRVHNFNPGPALLPLAALERAQRELLDFEGTGMSIMEHSHRGSAFEAVHNEAIGLVRELLGVPEDYHVLFLQGGATQQFAQVPMNLRRAGQSADYVVTGTWSSLAFEDGSQLGKSRVAVTTETEGRFLRVPEAAELELDDSAAYVHLTSNETIAGTQFSDFPKTRAPLVADMSSDILSRPIDVAQFGLIYAGAQKNLGPSGLTLVIVRGDIVDAGNRDIPRIFQYRTQAAANSMSNTPPTFGIYMLRNVLDWLKQQGGLDVIDARNREKATLLYNALDERPDLYRVAVERHSRSLMNVVFNLTTPDLEKECIAEAHAQGMVGLKGHRSVGGLRASIYNACPLESVRALAEFLHDFRR